MKVYTSNGVELAFSKEYTNDILVNPPEIPLEDGVLFQVYEKASFDSSGAGLLFTIGVMDELGREYSATKKSPVLRRVIFCA